MTPRARRAAPTRHREAGRARAARSSEPQERERRGVCCLVCCLVARCHGDRVSVERTSLRLTRPQRHDTEQEYRTEGRTESACDGQQPLQSLCHGGRVGATWRRAAAGGRRARSDGPTAARAGRGRRGAAREAGGGAGCGAPAGAEVGTAVPSRPPSSVGGGVRGVQRADEHLAPARGRRAVRTAHRIGLEGGGARTRCWQGGWARNSAVSSACGGPRTSHVNRVMPSRRAASATRARAAESWSSE